MASSSSAARSSPASTSVSSVASAGSESLPRSEGGYGAAGKGVPAGVGRSSTADGVRKLGSGTLEGRDGSAAGGGGGGSEGGGGREAAASAAVADSPAIDSLLALQAVEDPLFAKRKAIRRGNALLDTLDTIKADLLLGQVSEGRLNQLMVLLGQARQRNLPELDPILDDIELRARVELAKFGRFPAA